MDIRKLERGIYVKSRMTQLENEISELSTTITTLNGLSRLVVSDSSTRYVLHNGPEVRLVLEYLLKSRKDEYDTLQKEFEAL